MLSSKEKRECWVASKAEQYIKNNTNILDLRPKAVFVCLYFYMNKIAVLLFTFECQLNLTEEEDPGFFSRRQVPFCLDWLTKEQICTCSLPSSTDWPGQPAPPKCWKGGTRESWVFWCARNTGGELVIVDYTMHKTQPQTVVMWMLWEENKRQILRKPDLVDLVVQEAICSYAMSCHVLFMVSSTGQLLYNWKESWSYHRIKENNLSVLSFRDFFFFSQGLLYYSLLWSR